MNYAENAMNTIPTTSKVLRGAYAVIGGEKKADSRLAVPLSLILLNRGKHIYQYDDLVELERNGGFSEIISIENPGGILSDIKELSKQLPFIKFIVPEKIGSPGEGINIGMEEASSQYVMVAWDDMKFKVPVSDIVMNSVKSGGDLCSVPVLYNFRNEIIPSVMVPAFVKKRLKIFPSNPLKTGIATLFPFDYTGIYNKDIFMKTGGYDYSITSGYWQKMDFGFRTYLWGEKIVFDNGIKIFYTSELKQENISIDVNYRRFYLKNLAVKFNKDSGYLPKSRELSYIFRSGEGIISSARTFRDAAEWVELNKFRFKCSGRELVGSWTYPGI